MYRVFVLFLCVGAIKGINIAFKNCESKDGIVSIVTADPCTNPKGCQLEKGKNYTIGLQFKTNKPVESLKTVIHGIIAGIPVPFPFSHSNACSGCGLDCPLKVGETYHYSATLPVISEYPTVKLIAKWELRDENNEDVACVEMPLSIVNPKTKKIN